MRKVKFYCKLEDSFLEITCIPKCYGLVDFINGIYDSYSINHHDKDYIYYIPVFHLNKTMLYDFLVFLNHECKFLTTKKIKELNYGKR